MKKKRSRIYGGISQSAIDILKSKKDKLKNIGSKTTSNIKGGAGDYHKQKLEFMSIKHERKWSF